MANWTIDPAHSELLFKVRHLMITNVTGAFGKFEGVAETSAEDFSDAKISFSADIDSIDTNQAQRDEHLKSGDFFDAAKHPKLTIKGTLAKKGDESYTLKGDLTVKDVTKAVEFAVEYGGNMTDFYGNNKSGFEITGKINRKEFGLEWSAVTEAGGVVVGDDVKLIANIQVVKQ